MTYPHSAQRTIRPESSQKRLPFFEGVLFSPILARAASTNSGDIPESGTGIPIHSLRGFSIGLYFLLKSPGFAGGVRFGSNLRRLYHQIPYLLSGSSRGATSGDTRDFASS